MSLVEIHLRRPLFVLSIPCLTQLSRLRVLLHFTDNTYNLGVLLRFGKLLFAEEPTPFHFSKSQRFLRKLALNAEIPILRAVRKAGTGSAWSGQQGSDQNSLANNFRRKGYSPKHPCTDVAFIQKDLNKRASRLGKIRRELVGEIAEQKIDIQSRKSLGFCYKRYARNEPSLTEEVQRKTNL